MDKDKSGYVTKQEVLAYFAENKGCNIEKEKIDKILEYLEVKDNDSQVSWGEIEHGVLGGEVGGEQLQHQ